MNTLIRQIKGNWDQGYVLAKHIVSSTPTGPNEFGYMQFYTIRTEVGEALYQLKYKDDWTQVTPLARELADSIYPKFKDVGFLIPMPSSKTRERQPVTEITAEFGKIVRKPVVDNLLTKKSTSPQLKNLPTKETKAEALKDRFCITDVLEDHDPWNALLVDDLFDTGASLEAACAALRGCAKIQKIYVAVLTWK